jgi:YfiH family protein
MTVAEHEVRLDSLRAFRQSDWAARFPTLIQGISGRTPELDFGRVTGDPSGPAQAARPRDTAADGWTALRRATGISRVARCRQVHGPTVKVVEGPDLDGVHVVGEADALVTDRAGLLLAVTVADCAPVYFVEPQQRIVGLAHAGWRGTAAGVVGATLASLRSLGATPGALRVHLGPAICGKCYEVGPEVLAAFGLEPAASGHVDLRAQLLGQLVAAGVTYDFITTSGSCTRCEPERFYSYRGGDEGRRMCAYLGWARS